MYSKDEIAIQLKLNWSRFLEDLKESSLPYKAYIGRVRYVETNDIRNKQLSFIFDKAEINLINLSDPDKDKIYAHLLTLKRPAYKYEEEIRVILVQTESAKEDIDEKKGGIYVGPLRKKTIMRATISPSTKPKTTDLLKNEFKKRGIREVYHATLYDPITPRDIE